MLRPNTIESSAFKQKRDEPSKPVPVNVALSVRSESIRV